MPAAAVVSGVGSIADQRLLEVDEIVVLVVVESASATVVLLFVFLASGVVLLTPAGGRAGSFVPKRH